MTDLARQRWNPKLKKQGKQLKQIIYLESGPIRKVLPSGVQGCINFLPHQFYASPERRNKNCPMKICIQISPLPIYVYLFIISVTIRDVLFLMFLFQNKNVAQNIRNQSFPNRTTCKSITNNLHHLHLYCLDNWRAFLQEQSPRSALIQSHGPVFLHFIQKTTMTWKPSFLCSKYHLTLQTHTYKSQSYF